MKPAAARVVAERQPGRRATDDEKHLAQITKMLSDMEKENALLRCAVQDGKDEIKHLVARLEKARLEDVKASQAIEQLKALVDHEQALRRKAEATVYGRQKITAAKAA